MYASTRTAQIDANPVAIDLFCGAGGMSLGFAQAGFTVAAAIDNDPVHVCTYTYNAPSAATLCEDLSEVPGERLVAEAKRSLSVCKRDWDEQVACVFGGPTCQGFSSIGQKNPGDSRNDLVFEFARLVAEIRPHFFVMENVPGLLSSAYASVVRRLLKRFNRHGYRVLGNRPIVLDAADFGVPQVRQRVFLIGARSGFPLPTAPLPHASSRPTVFQAFAGLPDADDFDELLVSDEVALPADYIAGLDTATNAYVRSLRGRTTGDLGAWPEWEKGVLTSSARTVHGGSIIKRFAQTPPGRVETVGRQHRLHGDGQSPTLRAGTGRDHGSFTSSRPLHPTLDRVITVREAARLHSFPDWFRLHTTKWHGFRQVGNAVPPYLARAVAQTIMAELGERPHVDTSIPVRPDINLIRMSLVESAKYVGFDPDRLPFDVRRRNGNVEKKK